MGKIKRLNRSELLLGVATLFSQRATCDRLRVGAVIAREGRVCSTGYNGTPPGSGHCSTVNCDSTIKCKSAIHAEINAISNAAKHGVALNGTTLYITHSPCLNCCYAIIQSGIIKVIYKESYNLAPDVIILLRNANIELIHHNHGELPI